MFDLRPFYLLPSTVFHGHEPVDATLYDGGVVVDPARRGVLSFWMCESGRIGEAGYLLLVIFVMFFFV